MPDPADPPGPGASDRSDRSARSDRPDPPRDDAQVTADQVVELPLTDVLDLHGFAPREMREVVLTYLDEAVAAGFPGVRLIHGKGIGVQRESVRRILASDPRIASFADAPGNHGGWGATVITFRRPERP